MQKLEIGKYLGPTSFEKRFDGLIISQNSYKENYSSSWHYHENSYFAFILKGGSLERRKKNDIECTPGLLLFYNTQEPHKNEQYIPGSTNFNIEFENSWFDNMHINKNSMEGGMIINDAHVKSVFLKIMSEATEADVSAQLSIETSVLECFSLIKNENQNYLHPPAWLLQIKEMLLDSKSQPHSLSDLGAIFGIHPVTISRLFPHFFHCTIGEYTRKIKIARSLQLLSRKHISLADVSSTCGFADHGHFTRVFKKHTGFTPSQYREILLR